MAKIRIGDTVPPRTAAPSIRREDPIAGRAVPVSREAATERVGEATRRTGMRLPGTPAPRHFLVGAAGIQIAADSWGDPSGRLVLLLHGGGQTRHAWRATGSQLGAAGYFAVAFDARGHGDSDWPTDGDYSADAMVGDLECLIAGLRGEQPILIGASMGGITALLALGDGRVGASALILVDIVPCPEPEGVARIQNFMAQKPEGFASLEEAAESIRAYRPTGPYRRSPQGLAKNLRRGEDGRYRWHWDPRFLASAPDFPRLHERLSKCARQVTVPTLLVRGASSDVVSEEGVREFLNLCSHAEYVNVLQAGHMVAGDRNDSFGRAAIDFLERAVPVSRAQA